MRRLLRHQWLAVVLGVCLPLSAIHAQGVGTGVGVAFNWLRQVVSETNPIFAVDWEGGIADMGDSITLNGTTVSTPSFKYVASDQTTVAGDWPAAYGEDLPAVGSGGSIGNSTSLPNTTDQCFDSAGSRRYEKTLASSVPVYDFYFEVLFQEFESGSTDAWPIYFQNSSGSANVSIRANDTQTTLQFDDGGAGNPSNAVSTAAGSWRFAAGYGDRSGNIGLSVNGGTLAAGTSIASNSAAWSVEKVIINPLTRDMRIAYVAFWTAENWLNNDTDVQALVTERFAKLTGTWADTGSVGPSTATRSSSAYLTKYNATSSAHELYLVGDNWIRTGRYNDGTESRYNVQVEDSAENLCLYSEDIGGTGWNVGGGVTVGTGGAAPDPAKTAKNLSDVNFGYTWQNISITNTNQYAFSLFLEKLVGSEIAGVQIGAGTDYFLEQIDLSDGSTGSEDGSGVANVVSAHTSYVEDWGTHWRFIVVYTSATTSSVSHYIAGGYDALNSSTATTAFDWDVFGAQLELGSYASSYIPTTSAAVTRAAGAFVYTPSSDLPVEVTVIMSAAHPHAVNTGPGGTPANGYIIEARETTSGGVAWALANDAFDDIRWAVNGTDIFNNDNDLVAAWTDLRGHASEGAGTFWIDDVEEGTGAPTGLEAADQFGVGSNRVGAASGSSKIGPITIYPGKVEP